MKLRLVLASWEDPLLRQYLQVLSGMDITVDAVDSIPHLTERMRHNEYNGVLLDLRSVMRASLAERRFLSQVQDTFPVLMLNWDANEGCVRALSNRENVDSDQDLESLIRATCQGFEPRTLRDDQRVPLHISALVHFDPAADPAQAQRSVTLDVSETQCFLVSFDPPAKGTKVWLEAVGIGFDSLIEGEVAWATPWGGAVGQVPGFCVEMHGLSEETLATLRSLIDQSKAASDLSA